MELITDPMILFLDEPTSGLDSYTAHSITKLLVDYAHTGHTVVATLHQPSTDIFNLFDDFLLLNEGRVVFYGEACEVIGYFEDWGHEFPKYSNPADYIFMHVMRDSSADQLVRRWVESDLRIKMMNNINRARETVITPANTDSFINQHAKYKSFFKVQFQYLLNRASKNAIRNKMIIRVRFFQSVFIGVLAGLVFMEVWRGSFVFFGGESVFRVSHGSLEHFRARKTRLFAGIQSWLLQSFGLLF